jgi:hypothetical protein
VIVSPLMVNTGLSPAKNNIPRHGHPTRTSISSNHDEKLAMAKLNERHRPEDTNEGMGNGGVRGARDVATHVRGTGRCGRHRPPAASTRGTRRGSARMEQDAVACGGMGRRSVHLATAGCTWQGTQQRAQGTGLRAMGGWRAHGHRAPDLAGRPPADVAMVECGWGRGGGM